MFHLIKLVFLAGLFGFLVVTAAQILPAAAEALQVGTKGTLVEAPARYVADFLILTGEKASEVREKANETLETASLKRR